MGKKLNALFIVLVSAIIIIAPIKSYAASVVPLGVTYYAHVQNIGWQKTWASNGYDAGTVSQAKRLEAVKIKLTGTLPTGASIQYSSCKYTW